MKQDFTPEEWAKLISDRKARLVGKNHKINRAIQVRKRRSGMKNFVFDMMTILSFIMLVLICLGVL